MIETRRPDYRDDPVPDADVREKIPAMRKYSGHISNVFVVIMG